MPVEAPPTAERVEVAARVRPGAHEEMAGHSDAVEGQAEPTLVVLSRTHARALDLDVGAPVWLRPTTGATSVPLLGATAATA